MWIFWQLTISCTLSWQKTRTGKFCSLVWRPRKLSKNKKLSAAWRFSPWPLDQGLCHGSHWGTTPDPHYRLSLFSRYMNSQGSELWRCLWLWSPTLVTYAATGAMLWTSFETQCTFIASIMCRVCWSHFSEAAERRQYDHSEPIRSSARWKLGMHRLHENH